MKTLIVGPAGSGKTTFFLPKLLLKYGMKNYLISTKNDFLISENKNTYWKAINYELFKNQNITENDLLFIDEPMYLDFSNYTLLKLINESKNVVICLQSEFYIEKLSFHIDLKDFVIENI